MFDPKADRLRVLQSLFPTPLAHLDDTFGSPNISYVDWGNVKNWSNRLGWHVCHKRLHQFLMGFDGPTTLRFYYGTDPTIAGSEDFIQDVRRLGYDVHTKRVKHIKKPIDVSSISAESPDIIRHLIFGPLLNTFKLDLVKTVNDHLRDLNKSGTLWFEDLKCNFDVEIGRDMLIDPTRQSDVKHYSIWSGDSDFADPIASLLDQGHTVTVFCTSGIVARELNELRARGLKVFDVKKIREFICWAKEIPEETRRLL